VIDKSNGNYGSCVNAALPMAQGIFVRILDADDTYDNYALQQFIEMLADSEKNGENIDLFLTPYVKVGEGNKILGRGGYQTLLPNKIYMADKLYLVAKSIAMHSITYRTSCLMKTRYRQTERISYTDTEWCFMPIVAVRKWLYAPLEVYRYYIGREGQTVSRSSTIKNFWMYQKLCEGMMQWYLTHGFDEIYRPFLLCRLEQLSALLYQTIVGWLPVKSAVSEFDVLDKALQNEMGLYLKMESMTLSRFFRWRYVAFLRRHRVLRKWYLRMLKTYLWSKDIICAR
jgi:glycosyltransferase involved in cell wall biosynthesis